MPQTSPKPPPIPLSPQNSLYTCTCPPSSSSGTVLLFYRYFAASPTLPPESKKDTASLAKWHHLLGTRLGLTGKLRIAPEGFNITIAGSTSSINGYIAACVTHWSFAGLDLQSDETRRKFFKPTPGCPCVFSSLSVKVCEEITPMAVSNYSPSPASWAAVQELQPAAWHALLKSESLSARGDVLLLDVRNHYESSLGYFVDGAGNGAVRPQVRRFSQFPQVVRRGRLDGVIAGKWEGKRKVLSYCTGGIRCEKATRFMADNLNLNLNLPEQDVHLQIFTLKGGITAYISWVDTEIEARRMTPEDSLFKGKNYVFDSRRSIGLANGQDAIVGQCHSCSTPADVIRKCVSTRCQLELIICASCRESARGVVCCEDCRGLDTVREQIRSICECEREREVRLWGDEKQVGAKTQGWKTEKRKEMLRKGKEQLDIRAQLIQPTA